MEKRTTLKIIIIITALVLLGLCIWWSISIYQQNYNLWLNEYNAQMQQLGFYKKDIRLLNQHHKEVSIVIQLVFNVISYGSVITLGAVGYLIVD